MPTTFAISFSFLIAAPIWQNARGPTTTISLRCAFELKWRLADWQQNGESFGNAWNGTRKNSCICWVAAALHNFVLNETEPEELADNFIVAHPGLQRTFNIHQPLKQTLPAKVCHCNALHLFALLLGMDWVGHNIILIVMDNAIETNNNTKENLPFF